MTACLPFHPVRVEERGPGYEGRTPLTRQARANERAEAGQVVRKAVMMKVNPGAASEYERRHQLIWPEMEDTLREHGVMTYSIFLDPAGLRLFAYIEVESEEKWEAISRTAVCKRWWAYMKDIMPCNPDNSPISEECAKSFTLNDCRKRRTRQTVPVGSQA